MQKKKGISLIVLVITIIVMIVLAGAIILSLNNAGIIGNANKAVSDSDMATVKTAADLAYAEYLINNSEVDKDELQSWLNEKVDYEGYNVYVVKDETIVTKEGSLADKFYKGEIKVGDYVNYKAAEEVKTFDATDYQFISETNPAQDRAIQFKVTPDEKWRVLGVDSKTKELLLTSENLVKAIDKSTNTETKFTLSGLYGWVHGNVVMDNVCSKFGKGRYATKGRSMTADDVAILFEYDKTQYKDESYGFKYGERVTFGDNNMGLIYHPKIDDNGNYIFDANRVAETEYSKFTITNTRYVIRSNQEKYPEAYNLIFDFDVGDGYYLNTSSIYGGKYGDETVFMYYCWAIVGIKAENDRFLGSTTAAAANNEIFYSYGNKMYMRPVVHIDANVGATKDTATGSWILN